MLASEVPVEKDILDFHYMLGVAHNVHLVNYVRVRTGSTLFKTSKTSTLKNKMFKGEAVMLKKSRVFDNGGLCQSTKTSIRGA